MATTTTSTTQTITLASRASQLAKVQTYIVRDALASAFASTASETPKYAFETAFMSTAGDKNQVQALYVLGGAQSGGKSLWTEELEAALMRAPGTEGADGEGRVDMLVHSLKDVPTSFPPGCSLGAILEREDPVDALVMKQGSTYKSLAELPDGGVVGTSSVRRQAQLRRRYPKLTFMDVVRREEFTGTRTLYTNGTNNSAEICMHALSSRSCSSSHFIQKHAYGQTRRTRRAVCSTHPRQSWYGAIGLGQPYHRRS